jgi:hypothetical protein
MADQHISLSGCDLCEDLCKLVDNLIEGSRTRSRLAPGQPGAVVRAHPRKLRDFGLHDGPTQRRRRDAGFQQHDRTAAPPADGMQTMTAHVNEETRRRESSTLTHRGESLIEDTDYDERGDDLKHGHTWIVTPGRIGGQPRAQVCVSTDARQYFFRAGRAPIAVPIG